jgi:hypothetical protein
LTVPDVGVADAEADLGGRLVCRLDDAVVAVVDVVLAVVVVLDCAALT